MIGIDDLNVREQIIPLFDFTRNHFSRELLNSWFENQLVSQQDIEERQRILKVFVANIASLQDFSYSAADFHGAHSIMTDPDLRAYGYREILKYYRSSSHRHQIIGDFMHISTFFQEWSRKSIQQLDTSRFPSFYQSELHFIRGFLEELELQAPIRCIQRQKFGLKQVVALTKFIIEKQRRGHIIRFFESVQRFEVYISVARAIHKHGFVFPCMGGTQLDLRQAFHPALDVPVRNNIVASNNVCLLTGPNMSGKSTLLKTLSICVYLAHLGLAVPAEQASIPFFEHISVMVNHNDDLASGYSHFMMEIKRVKEVLVRTRRGETCFAVFDELFKGTNIDDAMEISKLTIEGLMQFSSCLFFISTHLHELKKAQVIERGLVDTLYLDCSTETGKPCFTYQVKQGWSDIKIGRILFQLEGLEDLLRKSSGQSL